MNKLNFFLINLILVNFCMYIVSCGKDKKLSDLDENPVIISSEKAVVVTPALSEGLVVNPGKGWVAYSSSPTSLSQEVLDKVSLGYNRYRWGNIEPEEGDYHWDIIDNHIKAWVAIGKNYAFGIACASTHAPASDFWVTPKYVFDAGAKYDTYEVVDPKYSTTGTEGTKLVPVFDDPVFMDKLNKFIHALAERYDGNPNIAFIDIRSYGNWGEAHMHPFDKPEISPSSFMKHVEIHRGAFSKTQLIVPWGRKIYEPVYDWAVSNDIGIRRDGIMGNSDGSETLRCDGKVPGVFEFYGSYDLMVERGWWDGIKDKNGYGYRLEDCFKNGKPTYCSLGGGTPVSFIENEPEIVTELGNRLGYHFVLLRAEYPSVVSKIENFDLGLTWENRGITQIYIPVNVAFALISPEGKLCDVCEAIKSIPSTWKSDTAITVIEQVHFSNAGEGEYILAVGIRRPSDESTPSIKIGIEQKNFNGWYELGSIKIEP